MIQNYDSKQMIFDISSDFGQDIPSFFVIWSDRYPQVQAWTMFPYPPYPRWSDRYPQPETLW